MNITVTYSCDNDEVVILIRKTLEMINADHAREIYKLYARLQKDGISDDECRYWSRKIGLLRMDHEMFVKPWQDALFKIYATATIIAVAKGPTMRKAIAIAESKRMA